VGDLHFSEGNYYRICVQYDYSIMCNDNR